jgi:hypothetical protein
MSKAVRKLRTRAQWAARIRAAHKETVEAILKLGRMLSAAKEGPKKLPHGEFLKMIETDLPFTASTAQRLMKIAADPKIANAARAQHLPPHWGALYELTKVPEHTFDEAMATGVVNPKMTREDAKAINIVTVSKPPEISHVNIVVRESPQRSLPSSVRIAPPETPSVTLLEKLERLETAVANLTQEAQQYGGITTKVEGRIRVAAHKLLSVLDDESLH